MFADTLALLDDCDIVHAHIFPFSPRAGTPAARMPQVNPAVARERAATLRARAAERRTEWLRRHVGTRQRVLVERPGDRGHAEAFAEVGLDRTMQAGTIADVAIIAVEQDRLVGVAA